MEKGKLFSESIGEILHLQTHKPKIFLKLLFPVHTIPNGCFDAYEVKVNKNIF